MTRRLFTSESVTEGHPDKIADQISDRSSTRCSPQDPASRVAVETLITTGQVHVAGEVTTEAYADIPTIVRERILEIGYDSSRKGFDGASCGVSVSIGAQSPDIAQGVDNAYEARVEGDRGRARRAGRRRPGPDVRLRLRRDAGADAAADRARAPAGRSGSPRCARTAPSRTCARTARPRSPSSTSTASRCGWTPSSCPASTPPTSTSTRCSSPTSREHVIAPELAEPRHRHRRLPAAGQPDRPVRDRRPDGRRRADRPQDHRRHLRRHGPPRRRRVLRQGSVEGRPLGRVRDALGGQERGRRRAGRAVRGAGRLRHRQGASRSGLFIETFGTETADAARSPRRSARSSTCARPRSSATST